MPAVQGGVGGGGGGGGKKKTPASNKEKNFIYTEEGCSYRTKWKRGLKQHRANVHNEGVIWHECPDLITRRSGKATSRRIAQIFTTST